MSFSTSMKTTMPLVPTTHTKGGTVMEGITLGVPRSMVPVHLQQHYGSKTLEARRRFAAGMAKHVGQHVADQLLGLADNSGGSMGREFAASWQNSVGFENVQQDNAEILYNHAERLTEMIASQNALVTLLRRVFVPYMTKKIKFMWSEDEWISGELIETAEGAHAPSMAKSQRTKEISIMRFGIDFEIDMNLWLLPEKAITEIEKYYQAMMYACVNKEVTLDLACLKNQSTLLEAALAERSQNVYGNRSSLDARWEEANYRDQLTLMALKVKDGPVAKLMTLITQITTNKAENMMKVLLMDPAAASVIKTQRRSEILNYSITGPAVEGVPYYGGKLQSNEEVVFVGADLATVYIGTIEAPADLNEPSSSGIVRSDLGCQGHMYRSGFWEIECDLVLDMTKTTGIKKDDDTTYAEVKTVKGIDRDQPRLSPIISNNLARQLVTDLLAIAGLDDAFKKRTLQAWKNGECTLLAISPMQHYQTTNAYATFNSTVDGNATAHHFHQAPMVGVSVGVTREKMRYALRKWMGSSIIRPDRVINVPNFGPSGVACYRSGGSIPSKIPLGINNFMTSPDKPDVFYCFASKKDVEYNPAWPMPDGAHVGDLNLSNCPFVLHRGRLFFTTHFSEHLKSAATPPAVKALANVMSEGVAAFSTYDQNNKVLTPGNSFLGICDRIENAEALRNPLTGNMNYDL